MAIIPEVPVKYRLRVATYNIRAGADVDRDVSVIAEDIRALDLDIVGLQEVDICTKRSNLTDQLQTIAELAGYPFYRFTFCMDYQDGEYGTAILSKYPIMEYKTVKLYSEGVEERSVGCAVIEVGSELIHYFNTHLSLENSFIRSLQFAQIAGVLADVKRTSESNDYIVTGDFNTEHMLEFRIFPDRALVNHGEMKSFPATNQAIDNIIVSPHWQIEDYGMVETGHSDHHLIYAILAKREYIPDIQPRRQSKEEILFGRKL